jgi:hypothetical protein
MKSLNVFMLFSGLLAQAMTAGCQQNTFSGANNKKNGSGASNREPLPISANGVGRKDDSGNGGPLTNPAPNNGSSGKGDAGFATNDTAVIPTAPEPMYASTGTALYSVNPLSGVATMVGQFNSDTQVWDIAIDGKGKMFAVDAMTLYAVNPLTAELTRIMDHGVSPINALTVLSDGTMVLAGNGVYLIDDATRTLSTLVPPGTYISSGDIIALPDRKLYWATRSTQDPRYDQLLVVNPGDGSVSLAGSIGASQVWGLGYARSKTYAFTPNGDISIISHTTGQIESRFSSNAGTPWTGAATNPVYW